MSINTYKLKAESLNGYVEIGYKGGWFRYLEYHIFGSLSNSQHEYIMSHMPQAEGDFLKLYNDPKINQRLTIEKLCDRELTTSEKIALFCRFFKMHKDVAYKVSPADSGKMATIPLSTEVLQYYFTSSDWQVRDRQSIAHLVSHWNEILALSKGVRTVVERRWPDYYDSSLEAKLKPSELKLYRDHLRSLGYEPKYDGRQQYKGWEKK